MTNNEVTYKPFTIIEGGKVIEPETERPLNISEPVQPNMVYLIFSQTGLLGVFTNEILAIQYLNTNPNCQLTAVPANSILAQK